MIDPAIVFSTNDFLIQDTVIINHQEDQTTRSTNYALSPIGFAVNQPSLYSDVLVNFDSSLLSAFNKENIILTEVQFSFKGFVYGGNICIKPVIGNWNYNTITYDDGFPSNGTQLQQQTISVSGAGYYTFSAYVKSVTAGSFKLKIQALNSSNTIIASDIISVSQTDGWQRYFVSIDAPSGINSIKVYFGFDGSKGEYHIDDLQLEKGNAASSYNYIENGSFNYSYEDYWTGSPVYTISETINGEAVTAL